MGKTNKQCMIGKKYGILTVISEIETRNKNGHILYNVQCDCGKEKQVLGASKTIKGLASATTINFHISGVEIA